MGGTRWSDDHYGAKAAFRAAHHTPTFAYSADVDSGKASGAHPTLDPKGVVMRESRDSDVHPQAVPVAVLCDVTGSMREVPRIMQRNLPKLMGLLIRKAYLEHPAILVGAIGDATCDRIPLQVGQFESGIEIENDLTNLYLEGGGGGHITESYELALYFMARHTVHDHWEKRGEKGYLFLIGDETPYPKVEKSQAASIIGATPEANIDTRAIMEEVRQRYHVFFILPKQTSNYDVEQVRDTWRKLVDQNLILLQDPAAICECIAGQIGTFEGESDVNKIEADIIDTGSTPSIAHAVSRALVPAGAGGGSGAGKNKGAVQKVADSGSPSGLSSF